jgi:hypothetical protein
MALTDVSREDRRAFWADVRRDYARLWPELRDGLREMREQWRELLAEVRQGRQLDRRMWQRITGKPDPARRDRRHAGRAIDAETRELEAIERRVIAEHERDQDSDLRTSEPQQRGSVFTYLRVL